MAKVKYKRHTDKEKYEAVALYKLVGSLRTTSTMTGVPFDTIRKWHLENWWKDYEQDIAQANRAKISNKITKLAEKAMEVVEDRLEGGDYQYDQRTGKIIRVPVKAGVANKILHDSLDREEMNERMNQDSKKIVTEEKMADRLLQIQEAFSRIALSRKIPQLKENNEVAVDAQFVEQPEVQSIDELPVLGTP